MRRVLCIFLIAGWCLPPLFLVGCTESPIGPETPIATTDRLRGQAKLRDQTNHQGIYVWLQGVNIGTFTDASGWFSLRLSPDRVGNLADLNGTYRLYFYVANYEVVTAKVAIYRGAFVYKQEDVDDRGILRFVPELAKRLDIQTVVVPRWAHGNFTGAIHVMTTLQATADTVLVLFPRSVGGLLGGILFRNVETNQIYPNIYDVGAKGTDYEIVGSLPTSRRTVFHLNQLEFRLPVAQYEVIPYFLIDNPAVPPELIGSLGGNVTDLTRDFLKIPMRRRGGQFRVID